LCWLHLNEEGQGDMGGFRRGVVAIAVVMTVLTGSATSAGAVASKAKKPKKPVSTCKLLTVAEITTALGTAPTTPPKQNTTGECDYSSPTDVNFININVTPLATAALWRKSVAGAGATIPVSGIGDEAFRSATNATIVVRKGKQTLRIDQYVTGLTEAQIESLGKAATARL
jgi:hypothetical protein